MSVREEALNAASVAPAAAAGVELSVVVPTFNESQNVAELVRLIAATLQAVAWEVIFVDDDSSDGTLQELSALARRDPRVRFIHRIGRRGLSSAVVEGILSTNAPYVAVMDADLQHDETLLPKMLRALRAGEGDVVVGSRYVDGGGVGAWDKQRLRASQLATKAAGIVARAHLTDPMSGFFMIERSSFMSAVRRVSGQGFKILLDLLASSERPLRVVELPYTFRTRQHGQSKLDTMVIWEYGVLLLDKIFGRFVPVRFLLFMMVGGAGVVVHMGVLAALQAQMSFVTAQSAATIIAMTFNFFVNNVLTYRDKRLRGFWNVLRGLLLFYAVCSVGAIANVGIANFLFQPDNHTFVSGNWFLSGLAGILVGAVWNYGASAVFTWRQK